MRDVNHPVNSLAFSLRNYAARYQFDHNTAYFLDEYDTGRNNRKAWSIVWFCVDCLLYIFGLYSFSKK